MSLKTDDLRILIVADDPLARAGLTALLDNYPGCAVAGQVSGEVDLAAALDVYRPDVVVWDAGWDARPALERLVGMGETDPPVVALLPDESHAAAAWAAGARGLLLRDAPVERVAAALTAVVEGLMILDPPLADAVRPSENLSPAPLAEELTPRESEVLQLLAEGLSNRAIAYRLGISEHTVKFHVNAIMSKLGAQSRTEAAVQGARLGLVLL
jgi:DNA-binding NarL/FixJ family response regulator